jgi:hypothetical protein
VLLVARSKNKPKGSTGTDKDMKNKTNLSILRSHRIPYGNIFSEDL